MFRPGTVCGSRCWHNIKFGRNKAVAKKFDPAPVDKHAEDPKRGRDANKKIDKDLDQGLKGSFPGSDPVSAAQPVKSRPDANPTIVEDGEHGPAGAKHSK
jgi:hypothetical protein